MDNQARREVTAYLHNWMSSPEFGELTRGLSEKEIEDAWDRVLDELQMIWDDAGHDAAKMQEQINIDLEQMDIDEREELYEHYLNLPKNTK